MTSTLSEQIKGQQPHALPFLLLHMSKKLRSASDNSAKSLAAFGRPEYRARIVSDPHLKWVKNLVPIYISVFINDNGPNTELALAYVKPPLALWGTSFRAKQILRVQSRRLVWPNQLAKVIVLEITAALRRNSPGYNSALLHEGINFCSPEWEESNNKTPSLHLLRPPQPETYSPTLFPSPRVRSGLCTPSPAFT